MTSSALVPSNQKLAVDNLIRRELKVGDPKDPQQIAQALADRYQATPRAQAIAGEAKGLPFLHTPMVRSAEVPAPVASDVDLQQGRNDVQQDLEQLIRDNLTKDIRPELEGWQSVIQRSIDEGVAAARFGLDPHKRDLAFAMRRQLGEYARLSRLIGALTPALNRSFRNLAISLDEVSSVVLVLMGESMANLGFSGGRFLLQAPYSELQARRDAVLNALRAIDNVSSLVGSSTWPRGLRAYRQLTTVLEARGQGDIRSLLDETELARTMDELVQLASGGTPHGLRGVGSTAWAPLNRLTRLVEGTLRQVAPASHELATLHEALLLFLDGFVPAGGFRLLRIARPTVLNYGLYGSANVTPSERRLIELVNRRGTLARHLDCLTQCVCDDNAVRTQIVLDMILFNVDRAIDFYCAGDLDLGLPETRAAACSHLIDAVLPLNYRPPSIGLAPALYPWTPSGGAALDRPTFLDDTDKQTKDIAKELNAIRSLLRPAPAAPVAAPVNPYLQSEWWATTEATYAGFLTGNSDWLGGGSHALRFATVLHDELRQQRQSDLEWQLVVQQMTVGCLAVDAVFNAPQVTVDGSGCLPRVIDRAIDYMVLATANGANPIPAGFAPQEPPVPRHFEESLEIITEWLP